MANSDERIHGKSGAIYLGGSKTGGGTKVAAKAEWTLNRTRDTVDVTSFGDTNKRYVVGLPDVSGTYRGTLDVSGDLLLTAATQDAQLIYLYADDGASPIEVAHGSGFIDATVTVNNTDAARINGNIRASDNWTITL